MNERKTLTGGLLATAVGVIIVFVFSEVGLRIFYPHWQDFLSDRFFHTVAVPRHGDVLTGRPGFNGYFAQKSGDFRVHIRINDFGLRNVDSVENADGRIWVVGDSMTFGWGVENDEMYSSVLSEVSDLLTYNIASPGTNVCGYQALVARMPATVQPRGVVVGLVLENDISNYNCAAEAERASRIRASAKTATDFNLSLIDLKVALTRYSALYNFTVVSLKRIGVITGFLETLGLVKKEHAYKVSFGEGNLDIVVEKTTDELVKLKEAFSEEIPFAVLFVPARFEIRDNDQLYKSLRFKLVSALKRHNIDIVDPYFKFKESGFTQTHFLHDGHWSPAGHRIAAEALASWAKAL